MDIESLHKLLPSQTRKILTEFFFKKLEGAKLNYYADPTYTIVDARKDVHMRSWYAMLRAAGKDTREIQKRIRRLKRRKINKAEGKRLLRLRKEKQLLIHVVLNNIFIFSAD